MTKQAFLFLHLQLHYPELAILHVSPCFRDFVVIYNSLPLVRAVLHVRALFEKMRALFEKMRALFEKMRALFEKMRALFEKMRARVDLQIARYYIVLHVLVQGQIFGGGGGGAGAPGAPPGSYASASDVLLTSKMTGMGSRLDCMSLDLATKLTL